MKDTRLVDLDALDYSRLAGADEYLIELLSPFVLASAYPDAADRPVPWWWETDGHQSLRRREERIVRKRNSYPLETVDHGQVVAYAGDEPVETARNGVTRVGTHAKLGFGELRVIPVESSTWGETVQKINSRKFGVSVD